MHEEQYSLIHKMFCCLIKKFPVRYIVLHHSSWFNVIDPEVFV